jgi:hypothetical protein
MPPLVPVPSAAAEEERWRGEEDRAAAEEEL